MNATDIRCTTYKSLLAAQLRPDCGQELNPNAVRQCNIRVAKLDEPIDQVTSLRTQYEYTSIQNSSIQWHCCAQHLRAMGEKMGDARGLQRSGVGAER